MRKCTRTCWIVGICVFVYFVAFPADIVVVIQPFEVFVRAAGELSHAVSPWLYATIIVAIVCWTVTRMWGNRVQPAAEKRKRAKAG